VAWLEVPLNMVFPAILFIGAGIACFPLVKRLKEPIQQKVLIGAALLSILCGLPFLIPQVSQNISSLFWFLAKVSVFIYVMIWFRGTFPRFRYDQLMDIGWKRLIPLGLGCLLVNAVIATLK
jgi:NADH-quinone oxidoreductase subunit H